jgi:hypothetical protein
MVEELIKQGVKYAFGVSCEPALKMRCALKQPVIIKLLQSAEQLAKEQL